MDLSYLRPLFAGDGPWASVYLDATSDERSPGPGIDARWQTLAGHLTSQGADPGTVAAIGEAIRGHPRRPGRHGLAIFASGGRVVLAEPLDTPPAAGLAVWAPLPHAMPLVAQREMATARADRSRDESERAVAEENTRAAVADQNTRAALARFGAGPHAGGLAEVVVSLRDGRVEQVLLVDDPSSTDRLWIGPGDPRLIASEPGALSAAGVRPVEVRADAALLRAVVGTGAGLLLIGPDDLDLPHGIGAILHDDDPPDPA
ncbi:hypothetical protein ACIA5D_14585 [Actinoplanes sp. NPDC051513]|uniref:hypothetical protein n=1 Tax=Actinoplanes sp. NPDC051513 TaxID=3363908 RepID=UPI0037A34573